MVRGLAFAVFVAGLCCVIGDPITMKHIDNVHDIYHGAKNQLQEEVGGKVEALQKAKEVIPMKFLHTFHSHPLFQLLDSSKFRLLERMSSFQEGLVVMEDLILLGLFLVMGFGSIAVSKVGTHYVSSKLDHLGGQHHLLADG